MKELFREKDITRMAFYKSVLEAEGIATHIRNESLTMSGLTEIPIPEFYPALCVVNDEDYQPALALLRQRQRENAERSDETVLCEACGEASPGNFDSCWSCGAAIPVGA